MKVKSVFLFAVVCLLAGTINAQKALDKPFQKWSQDDALKILNTSPWAKSYQSAEGMAALDKAAILKEQDNVKITPGPKASDGGAQGATLTVAPVLIRLHSSLVIRQAYVRLQQLAAGYDKMDDAKRAAFDNSVKDLLACPLCQNYYIVTMTKSVNSSGASVDEGLFQTMTLQQMKGNVWIVNEKGIKSELAQFIAPKGGKDMAVFFFPRRDPQGNDYISPESKNFRVTFSGEFLTPSNPYA
ncbi:MAG TPA: hypothetical protein VHQ01_09740, partial [Pyrinomonadaceae bacterium]|nr:hypothetical protein [Pyrinomonadaceae bacterium]